MKEHDKFISTFKEIEFVIRENNPTIPDAGFKWYEDRVTDDGLQQRLRLCRNIRNFIQHNQGYEKFISITPEMQKEMDDLLVLLKSEGDISGKKMLPPSKGAIFSESDLIYDAFEKIGTKSILVEFPVTDTNGVLIGFITLHSACKMLSGATKRSKISSVKTELDQDASVRFVEKTTSYKTALEMYKNGANLVLVTSDGTKNGKLIGIVKT